MCVCVTFWTASSHNSYLIVGQTNSNGCCRSQTDCIFLLLDLSALSLWLDLCVLLICFVSKFNETCVNEWIHVISDARVRLWEAFLLHTHSWLDRINSVRTHSKQYCCVRFPFYLLNLVFVRFRSQCLVGHNKMRTECTPNGAESVCYRLYLQSTLLDNTQNFQNLIRFNSVVSQVGLLNRAALLQKIKIKCTHNTPSGNATMRKLKFAIDSNCESNFLNYAPVCWFRRALRCWNR